MFNASGHEGLFLLVPLLLWLIGILALYWIIRLAVRHGVLDAQRRGPGGPLEHGRRAPGLSHDG